MGGGARSGGEDLGALLPALGEEEQLEGEDLVGACLVLERALNPPPAARNTRCPLVCAGAAGRLQSSNKQLRPALGGEVTQDGLTQARGAVRLSIDLGAPCTVLLMLSRADTRPLPTSVSTAGGQRAHSGDGR